LIEFETNRKLCQIKKFTKTNNRKRHFFVVIKFDIFFRESKLKPKLQSYAELELQYLNIVRETEFLTFLHSL
jgi:hypothetical protein